MCISIGGNNDIQGIPVDNEEIKLGLFADDLTGFVRNNHSLTQFLDVVERFGARLQKLIWRNSLYYKRELCA